MKRLQCDLANRVVVDASVLDEGWSQALEDAIRLEFQGACDDMRIRQLEPFIAGLKKRAENAVRYGPVKP